MKNFDKYIKKLFDNDEEQFPNMDKNWGMLNQKLDRYNSLNNNATTKFIQKYFWRSMVALLLVSNGFLFYKMNKQSEATATLSLQKQKVESILDSVTSINDNAVTTQTHANALVKKIEDLKQEMDKSNAGIAEVKHTEFENKKGILNSENKATNHAKDNKNISINDDKVAEESNNIKNSEIQKIENIEIANNTVSVIEKSDENSNNTDNNTATKGEKRQITDVLQLIPYPSKLNKVVYENTLELPFLHANTFVKPVNQPIFRFTPSVQIGGFIQTGIFLNNRDLTTISGGGFVAECMISKYLGFDFSVNSQESEFQTRMEKFKDFNHHVPPVNDPNKPPRQDFEFRSLKTKIESQNFNFGLKFKLPTNFLTPTFTLGHNWSSQATNPIFVEFKDQKDGQIKQDIDFSIANKEKNIWYMGLGIEKSIQKWTFFSNGTYYRSNDLGVLPNRIMVQLGVKYKIF
jgi:hypothetical protein